MCRITVSVDDALVALAKSDVAAGRAASVSAWVADAMRATAAARAELIADLEAIEQHDPTPREVIEDIARSLGRSPAWVLGALGLSRPARHK
ncbi:MAG: hypothetical protein HY744_05710 [Deltaproteobacteria bacterium]|nr:hypothetical protein [Deltaproteobacteria bacterium]